MKRRVKLNDAERLPFAFPIPTRAISNGEYDPERQSERQRKVESEIKSLVQAVSNEKGVSRREILYSASAIAIGLLAMNRVFGPYFNLDNDSIFNENSGDLPDQVTRDQIVFDMQTHLVKDDFHHKTLLRFAEWSKNLGVRGRGRNFDVDMELFKFPNYLKEVFVDSDTDLAMLSGAPFSNGEPLPNELLYNVVDAVNEVVGAEILFANHVVNPNIPHWLEDCRRAFKTRKPLSCKLFPVGDPLSPTGRPWRLDDEKLIYPFYELAMESGVRNITIHKGLTPKHYEHQYPNAWKAASVDDLKKAARDWPELNFVIFHSALRPFASDSVADELREFGRSGYIRWTSDLIRIQQDLNASNIYAELGTSFATACITEPEFCAAFLGSLINGMGYQKVLWGTDSVWYGSPQWQIEAFRRFSIPEEMMVRHDWKVGLGGASGDVRNAILGENAIRLFGLSPSIAKKKAVFRSDWIESAKAALVRRSNRYYGYYGV